MLSAAPLDPAQIFADLEPFSKLLLAVSGGPDSLALLRLAAMWRDAGAKTGFAVATVDHGLRENSAHEAECVALWAEQLGFSHKILRWEGEKPKADLQQKARAARYGLLFAHAEKIGAQGVVTAHHLDDQFETVLMRFARGSGVSGLAGMARAQNLGDGLVLRPLLATRKQQLIDFCAAQDQAFFEDPSNRDPHFARARWRAAAPALEKLGLTAEIVARLADRAAKTELALDYSAQNLFSCLKKPECDGYDFARLDHAPIALVERCLALAFVERVGVAPARLERLERLAENLRAARRAGKTLTATLEGCVVRLAGDGGLTLAPEPPRRRGQTR